MNSKAPLPIYNIQVLKSGFFLLSCLPVLFLLYRFLFDNLGANPIEEIIRYLGLWAYHFLILTLSISVLREQFRLNRLFFLRRMFGLFTFFYASIHFLAYIVLDQYFDWMEIWLDIKDRPLITSGFLALLLLLPLTITSNIKSIQYLGALQWRRLHKLIYLISICALLHYYWMVKLVGISTFIYLFILTMLLFYRIPFIRRIKWFQGQSN
ncbi:MAG TPA: protein-methionine-sulfoxide reductase heme-binding subunit MsrQ [Pseudomonadales bacterium]